LASLAVAAPIPKERPDDALRRLFGTPVDPDKDCKIEMDGNTLRISVPGVPHRLVPTAGPSNAPRVTRPVEGEFTATVTIKVPKTGPNPAGNFYAGLFLETGDGTYLYHARMATAANGAVRLSGMSGLRGPNGAAATSGVVGDLYDADIVIYRMIRTKDRVQMKASKDGTSWEEAGGGGFPADLPAKVTVGLFASHDGQTPLTTEFREFTVAPLKK
jgi:hypothetical protein